MTRVDRIKEVRQLKYLNGLPIREISRQVHLSRNTIRKILRSGATKFTYQRTNANQPVTGPIISILENWIKEDLQKKRNKGELPGVCMKY